VFTLAHPPIRNSFKCIGSICFESTKKARLVLAAFTDSNDSWSIRIYFSWNVRNSVRLYVHT